MKTPLQLKYKAETGNDTDKFYICVHENHCGEFGVEYVVRDFDTHPDIMKTLESGMEWYYDVAESDYVKWLEEQIINMLRK
jgi:hypothetical protein